MDKVASIDIGLKRIGVAVAIGEMVFPRDAIIRKNRNQASREVSSILREESITKLVVGIPLGGSSEDEMRARVNHFISLLDFDGEVFLQDESFTSFEAKEIMKGKIKQKRDGKVDSISAKLILERWLKI